MNNNANNYEYVTYEEFEKYQIDENKTLEYDNGYIYYMTPVFPNHDRVKNKIAHNLVDYIGYEGPCEVFTSDVAVVFTNEDSKYEYEPDIMLCCDPNKFSGAKYKGIPSFIVEILSYTTKDRDKGIKLEIYSKFGVNEYWIVNIDEKVITAYSRNVNGKYMSRIDYIQGMNIQCENGFSITVDDIFSVLK